MDTAYNMEIHSKERTMKRVSNDFTYAILRPDSTFLNSLLDARRSSRVFLPVPVPVPEPILMHCLTHAQRAPSNSNIPTLASQTRHRRSGDGIIRALSAEAEPSGPKVHPLPDEHNHFRSARGANPYGTENYDCLGRDKTQHREMQIRIFDFFGPPVLGVVYMDRQLTRVDGMTVRMYMQNLTLGTVDNGLGSCWQVSITGSPELLRCEFGLAKIQDSVRCDNRVAGRASSQCGRDWGKLLEECVTFLRE